MFLLRILSHFCKILNRDENIVNFLRNSQYGCYGKVLYRAWLNRYKMLLQSLETSDISGFHFARRCYRVVQSFLKDDIFEAGITEVRYNNSVVRVYDRERLLIEMIRFRSKVPLDYYKEIINNYRDIAFELDFGLVEEYAALFKNSATLMRTVQMEVL